VDQSTNLTVAAAMVRYASSKTESSKEDIMFKGTSLNVIPFSQAVSQKEREKRNGHRGYVVWLTGLVRSGKSTIAKGLAQQLFKSGKQVFNLDGDMVRHGLCGDLGFSEKDRRENVRRIAHVARMMTEAGQIVICSLISPRKEMREFAKSMTGDKTFFEIYVKCDIKECQKRDKDGLYQKAIKGEIPNFTGITADFEEPENPDLILNTESQSAKQSIDELFNFLKNKI
jgi:adenylyl-sulfate kinase